MNARSVSELGECVLRAMKGRQTPHGIAMAVEAEVVEPLRMQLARTVDESRMWRDRLWAEQNVRWDSELPPGGLVCATCGEPVESERCPEHSPTAVIERQAREVERLRASAEGAHRRINAALDYLATKDATQLSEDAGAMGFHIVAVLDSPPHPDEEVPVRPALPWASLITDAEASDLVSELASLFLDYWRGDRPDDVATLREVGRLLAEHRDRAARELARAAGTGGAS